MTPWTEISTRTGGRPMLHEFRLAARALRRRPGYSAACVLTVALGVGANAAVFRLVEDQLLRPLAFSRPGCLVVVHETDRHNGTTRESASMPDYFDWRRSAKAFSALAAFEPASVTVAEPGHEPERRRAAAVAAGYLPLTGVQPQLGRGFSAAEDRPGGETAVMISDAFWRDRFGAAADVLGRSLEVDGQTDTIVGVLPPGIEVPAADLWLPLEATETTFRDVRGSHSLVVVGRLADGVSVGEAQAEMTTLAGELETHYPEDNAGRGVFVEPLRQWIVGDTRSTLSLVAVAVALVLLVACVNVAGLSLARALAREGELAVRLSLGASRADLVRQGLAENLWIALVGALAGALAAVPLLRLVLRLAPGGLPRPVHANFDLRLFATALAAALFVALAVSAISALRASRLSAARVLGERASGSRRTVRLRRALVVGEIAGATALVAVSALLLTSFERLSGQDPGVRVASTLVGRTSLPPWRYPMPKLHTYPVWPEVTSFYDRALTELRSLPGVDAAALALNNPMQQGWTSQIVLDGNPRPAGERDEVRIRPVTPGYLETVGLPLLAGREIDLRDRVDAPATLMVNRAFARHYFGERSAVGHTVDFWGVRRTIVGVVGDERFLGLDQAAAPAVYPSLHQVPMPDLSLIVHRTADAAASVPDLEKAVHRADPSLAVYEVRPLSQVVDASVATPRLRTFLFALFALLAATLAAVGIYGLVAFDFAQRGRELALRTALGARASAIVALVVRGALGTASIGVALGLVAAVAAGRIVRTMLFATSPFEPLALAGAVGIGLLLALVAAARPAWRATHLDPASLLREP